MEGDQNDRSESINSTLNPVIHQAATNDFMAELFHIENDIFLPPGEEILEALFQQDKSIPLDDYTLKGLNAWEEELTQLVAVPPHGSKINTASNLNLSADSSEQVNISITPGLASQAFTSTVEERSSQGGNNMSVVNPILSSQNIPNLCPAVPSAMNSTTFGVRTINPQGAGASFGNTQLQSSLPPSDSGCYGGSSGHQGSEMNRINPLDTPANELALYSWLFPPLRPQNQQTPISPPPSSTMEFQVEAWEGCLIGRIHSHRSSFNTAKAWRRSTSPIALTAEWPYRLEITIFIPQNAVNFTHRLCGGPIDYMLFAITETNDVNLSDHLTSKNLCAKIRLPSQTVVLSPTESKYYYIGSVYQGDAIFAEPV